MASLKEKLDTNMTKREKENARFESEKLIRHLLEAGYSFRVSAGKVGCFTILIPDEAGDDIAFYFSDSIELWNKEVLVYESTWNNHDYDLMISTFVNQ